MKDPALSTTIQFNRDGVQHGHLILPHSHDKSAWGAVMIPITVARNGAGPTLLLTGGNHGDEYEGPVALFELAATVKAEDLNGRIIIIPAMNYPAFRAGARTSPIDRGNLNRLFPGNPAGTITEKIADYFQRVLLPMADVVLDIHSGGKTLEFVPFCAAHYLPDREQQQRAVDAMQAFNAPYSIMMREVDAAGMYDTAAEEMGKTFITTEIGGGGTVRADSIEITRRGIQNLAIHTGIVKGEMHKNPTMSLTMPEENCFVRCHTAGLVSFCVGLGETVTENQKLAEIYDIGATGKLPIPYRSPASGILIGRHHPGLIDTGDMLAVLAQPVHDQ